MSRLEPTEFINDRYSKMEENLAVSLWGRSGWFFSVLSASLPLPLSIDTALLPPSSSDRAPPPQPPPDAGRKGELQSVWWRQSVG